MSDPMTARQAWEIVREGEPTVVVHFMRDGVYESTEAAYVAAKARYARACAIVEAKIVEHELTVQLESDPENIKLSLARGQAYLKVRALERGKGEGK